MISTSELFRLIRGPIAIAEPLGPYTGLRIGGTADYFIKPRDRDDLCRAHGYFRKHGFPFFILGRGSRLLVHESGFRGTVISTQFLDRVVIEGDAVEADAGVPLPVLQERLSRLSLGGLDNFGHGAGTVGGALCRIDGTADGETPEYLEWVDVLRNGRIRRLRNGELHSRIGARNLGSDVVLGAGFRLRRISVKERHQAKVSQVREELKESGDSIGQPALSGRVFRDPCPPEGSLPVSAGALLSACGIEGARRGGASFAAFDANRIVNDGMATSADVLDLVRLAKEAVQSRFGVDLELELVLVGNNMNGIHAPFNR